MCLSNHCIHACNAGLIGFNFRLFILMTSLGSLMELTVLNASGESPISASTAGRTSSTNYWPSFLVAALLPSGAVSSPSLLSTMSGSFHHAWRSAKSTAVFVKEFTQTVQIAALYHVARPWGESSTISKTHKSLLC